MAEITYLMGSDPGGAGYFTEAEGFFGARPSSTVVKPAGAADRTLEEVFADLRARAAGGQLFPVINLVSHATGFSSLQFPISVARRNDEGGLITTDTLKSALSKAGTDGYPAVLGAPAVTKATTVCLYGCDVGRDASFMVMLGQLFGPELTIYAPLRVAVFRHLGSKREHRLARTWAVNFDKDVNQVTAWPPVRTDFVARAVAKFSGQGDTGVAAAITAAASSATHTSAGSFFFSTSLETTDDPATSTIEGASSVLPAGTVDDSTIPVRVKSSDFTPVPSSPGVWVAWIAVLAQVLETPVSIDDASQFRKTVITSQRAPSTNPLVPAPTTTHTAEDPMTELYGKHRATVVDSEDPTSQGRLQVDVPSASVSAVWAEASIPPVPQSLLRMPEVGSTIWVEFEQGDVARPIWTGATWGTVTPGPVSLESDGVLTLRAASLNVEVATLDVEAAVADYSGVLKSQTLITDSVVAASYTPGAGNIM